MAFWFWFFVGPAIALALLSLRGERRRAEYVEACLTQTLELENWPRATVIVPVKGWDEGLRENLASLASLDYADYELIVAARTAADIPPGVLPSGVKVVVGSEQAPGASEKIQNLNAAIRMTRKTSTVLAFADSDGRVPRGWLRALVAPLEEEGVGATTGYRWYVPQPPDFWSLMRSVWNAPVAGLLGPGDNPFAWGGAMAIRRDLFLEISVPEYWNVWVSDDYALARAVHAAGLRVVFAPGATVAASDHVSCREFFGWARRQMRITRAYHPRLWQTALAAHFFYCGGMAAAVTAAILGNRMAEWALLVQLSPGLLKATNRLVLAKAELPGWEKWFKDHGWVHVVGTPLATWVWLIVLIASAFSSTIEWRGKRYVLRRNPVQ